jgi:hypothetical protein
VKRYLVVVAALAALNGCGSTTPVKIGANTYYASETNSGGAFGNVDAVAGKLMVQGNQFCSGRGEQFELVTQNTDQPRPFHMGGASITFKCVDQAQDPVMRKDNGVNTVENR